MSHVAIFGLGVAVGLVIGWILGRVSPGATGRP